MNRFYCTPNLAYVLANREKLFVGSAASDICIGDYEEPPTPGVQYHLARYECDEQFKPRLFDCGSIRVFAYISWNRIDTPTFDIVLQNPFQLFEITCAPDFKTSLLDFRSQSQTK